MFVLMAVAPASAEVTHRYESQIVIARGATRPLPWGLAFTPEGDLLAADARSGLIDVFDSAGAPVPPPITGGTFVEPYRRSVAASAATGVLYVGESGQEKVDVLKPLGAGEYGLVEEHSFGGYVYVAVDNSTSASDPRKGDVYVLAGLPGPGGMTLQVFKPGAEGKLGAGEEVKALEGFSVDGAGGFTAEGGLAVDPATGTVYVANPEAHEVDVFSNEGVEQPLAKLSPPPGAPSFSPVAVTVDRVSGQEAVYVVDQAARVVDEYSIAGTWLGQIKGTEVTPGSPKRFQEPLGVVVAEHAGAAQGRIYVADGTAEAVDVFASAGLVRAEVTTAPPSGLAPTAATLNGTVNPVGVEVTSCRFEYRTSTETTFASSAACAPAPGSGSAAVPVTGALTGLSPNTTYRWRLAATNANLTSYSEEETFVTPGPPQVRGEASEVRSTEKAGQTTATLSAEVHPGNAKTTYRFQYGETTSYGTNVTGELEGTEFLPVSTELTGLKVGTTYHYRVLASNEYGEFVGPDHEFTTTPALLFEESVTKVTAESATFRADINPLGNDTTYYFQYGTVSCTASPGSCTNTPASPADIGSGEATVEAPPLDVHALTPGTTYHYRLLATNSLGAIAGPDRTFTTQATGAGTSLLDGRGWELVSPPDKHGTSLESITEEGGLIQAAEDGSGLAYIAKGPVQSQVEGNRSISTTQLLAHREKGGWETRDITAPHENPAGIELGDLSEYEFFSNDLSVGFLAPQGATKLAPQATEYTPYLRETPTGRYVPLVYPGNVPPGTKWGGPEGAPEQFQTLVKFGDATPDGKHAIVGSQTIPLTAGGAPGDYEWTAGQFTPIGEIPTLPATSCGGAGPACSPAADAGLGSDRSLSEDGNRVAFVFGGTKSTPPAETGLFVRDLARKETVHVDVPQAGASGESGHIQFPLISGDGHRVFFEDQSRLTTDSTASNKNGGGRDLYMCTIEVLGGHLSCALKDLTVDPHPGETGDVRDVVIGTDTTGQHVYFVANGALVPGAVKGTCTYGHTVELSAAASCNLYVYDAASEKVSLIAVLSNRDGNDWGTASHQNGDLSNVTSRVSPNGKWLAFMSRRPLTGFDNRDARTGEPDEEVFLYDASAATLRCVSCAATGARPSGVFDEGEFPGMLVDRPQLWKRQGLAGSIPGWTGVGNAKARHQSRYLSDEGRLFFNSPVGLVPGDGNGKEDVYEFEPAGVGGCTQPTGCQALISSGASADESAFLDASATGEDVFFMTSSKLVSADTDEALDVYDAHVCSAVVPCPSGVVSVSPSCTTADSCRAASAAQPTIFGAPASATFTGPGGVTSLLVKPAVKSLTRAQKLAKALRACRTKRDRHKRTVCEKRARRAFGRAGRANTSGRGHR